jgi:hypothetical protein
MKKSVSLAGIAILVLWLPLMLAASGKKENGTVPEGGTTPKDFLRVGQSYYFVIDNDPGSAKGGAAVLEKPSESWVKVRFRAGNRPSDQWINLNHVKTIIPIQSAGDEK